MWASTLGPPNEAAPSDLDYSPRGLDGDTVGKQESHFSKSAGEYLLEDEEEEKIGGGAPLGEGDRRMSWMKRAQLEDKRNRVVSALGGLRQNKAEDGDKVWWLSLRKARGLKALDECTAKSGPFCRVTWRNFTHETCVQKSTLEPE
eukprot:GHVU01066352.1.p3 GENE.GHVU01066352.1~~GHVU01066352.1.p3  ORF type:complete len:146 (+),score=30.26 GHVU01066352.1:648-1085(+)